jgi:membrane-associated phospholipid phosphatase
MTRQSDGPSWPSCATTAAPLSNANVGFWEFAVGGLRQYQFWGGQLARLTLEHRLDASAPRVARAFALTYAAMHDVGVACWDAKYAYWTIRPVQLDPELRTVVPTPNHPSYPAAHACYSSAAAAMLGYLFLGDAEAVLALAAEAAESRIWAGIHFRSDVVAGLSWPEQWPTRSSVGRGQTGPDACSTGTGRQKATRAIVEGRHIFTSGPRDARATERAA